MAPPWPTLAWMSALDDVLPYLPLALPFALATVVGGIDNTESASAAGDEYRTRDILLTEAIATIAAGSCGGVVQNTPYIGHPAYKAMGARSGYTLATGLVIGAGAAIGVVSLLVSLLPEAAVAPILIFIGLEITAQAFGASPPRHAPAVALSFVPAVAAVVLIQANTLLAGVGKSAADLTGDGRTTYSTLLVARQRLRRDGVHLGLRAGRDRRPPAARRGGCARCRRGGDAVRRDPLAPGERRRVLAVVCAEQRPRRPGRRLRRRGGRAPSPRDPTGFRGGKRLTVNSHEW